MKTKNHIIGHAKLSEAQRIAEIHHGEQEGLISGLGLEFTKEFFRAIFQNKQMYTLVYREKQKVIGYVSVSSNRQTMIRTTIQSNPRKLLSSALQGIVKNPSVLIRLAYLPLFPRVHGEDSISEVVAIAVDRNHQRKGIGRKLMKAAMQEIKKRGGHEYLVMTFDRLPQTNAFYLSLGGKRIYSGWYVGEKVNYYKFKF